MIHSLEGESPVFADASHWLAPSADLIGRVRIGRRVSVWFAAVLRGDDEWIEIGDDSNVQDGAVLHADAGLPTVVSERVTIGHKAMLHGCVIGDDSLVGIGAIVLDGARIGRGCLIGAGALVTPRVEIADGMLVLGSPARAVRALTDAEQAQMAHGWQHYVAAIERFRTGLETA